MNRIVSGVLVAASAAVALCGCDLGSVRAQLMPTSVADAREQLLSARPARVADSALVTPGTLTVGLNDATTSAPLVITGESGQVSGVEVDLAAAIAQELGLKVAYVSVGDPASAVGTSCDIVLGVKSTSKGSSYSVSGAYAESATAFFRKGDGSLAVASDLSGKRLGLQTGSVSDTALRNTGLSASVQGYVNLNEAFDALEAGKVDFVLCDAYSGAFLSRSYKDVSFAGTLDSPVSLGFACSTSNAALQSATSDALSAVQGNGVYGIIRSRWVGGLPQLGPTSQVKNIPAPTSTTEQASAPASASTEGGNAAAGSNAVTF